MQQLTQGPPAPPEGNQFMLLMFTRQEPALSAAESSGPESGELSESQKQEYQAVVYEYRDWARAREAEGRLVGADKLAGATRVMTRPGGPDIGPRSALDNRPPLGKNTDSRSTMSTSRTPGIVLLVIGGLLLGAGAYTYSGTSGKTAPFRQRIEADQALLDSTRAELRTVSLRYQGFAKSGEAVPDSIRRYEAGTIWRQSQTYANKIYLLERKERDLKLEMTKLRKREGAAKRRRLVVSIPLAAIGAGASLAGILLLTRSRPRPVAA